MLINGFEVDKYNVHGIQENVRHSTCPLCSESRKKKTQKCLSVFWDTGMAKCSHCGEVIQLHTYKKKNSNKIFSKPTWQNNTNLSDNLVKWFEGRKITQFTLRRLKITEGKEWMPQTQKEENTIQFNYFRENELINVKYRDGRKNFKMFKDAEKIPYNLDNIRTSKEVIIVEGEIDVLTCVECGKWNAISSPNGSTTKGVNLEWLDNSYDYFENKEKIILALDDDDPGQNVQKEIIRRLGAERCYIVDLFGENDYNDLLQKQGKDKVIESIENAKQCPLENVNTLKDIRSSLHDFYMNGVQQGFKIGVDNFDDIFSTYTGQYITVTGIPSSGKSEWVDQMTIGYSLNYDWKIGYCSPENKPTFLHVDKICRKIAGFKPSPLQINTTKWKITEDYVNDHFFFMDFEHGYSLKEVLKKGAELVKRKGIKCLVIDPFNKVNLKESRRSDINQYTNDYLTEIDNFCRKYDVLVILVAHPVKMRKENGITPEPDFYDIKGGGEHYDMSYHGLLVHRNYEAKTVKVKVLKVKFGHLGENRAETNFSYHSESGRYLQISGDHSTISHETIFDNSFWLESEDKQEEISHTMPINEDFDNMKELPDAPF
jgi:twinkle protein